MKQEDALENLFVKSSLGAHALFHGKVHEK